MANLKETVEWIDGIYQIEKNDPVVGGEGGISNRQAEQLANRTGYLKKELEKRATTESPVLTGTPTAPTPAQSVNNQQIATTAFVKAAIAALVGSAPETLDTLAEIAMALGNDGNLKQVLLNEIVKKANLADFTALKYLLVGIPFPYPLSEVPLGCLAFNGQAFSTSTYPELAKKYSSGRLPDLRGEFIRGWDNGRGVDIGRGILSAQIASKMSMDPSVEAPVINGLLGNPTEAGLENGELSRIYDNNNTNNSLIAGCASLHTLNTSGFGLLYYSIRPRNIAFQYICLAA